jgi:hypothetical protein
MTSIEQAKAFEALSNEQQTEIYRMLGTWHQRTKESYLSWTLTTAEMLGVDVKHVRALWTPVWEE